MRPDVMKHSAAEAHLSRAVPGMAGLPDPAIARRCGECVWWGDAKRRASVNHKARCKQAVKMFLNMRRAGAAPAISRDTPACRHFNEATDGRRVLGG